MYDFWSKRVLLPCWIIQILFAGALAVVGGLAIAAGHYVEDNGDEFDGDDGDSQLQGTYDSSYVSSYLAIAGGIYLGLTVLTIIINITEIILYARKKLSPVTLVVLECLTTAAWLFIFALLIVSAIQGNASGLGWVLSVGLLSTSLSKLIYGSTMLHRFRKGRIGSRGHYTPAHPESGFPTAYSGPAHAAPVQPNPFRDPSREPSPAPPYKTPGAATEYYDAPPQSFEMQNQHQHQHQQGETRYA